MSGTLQPIDVARRPLGGYGPAVGPEPLARIRRLAEGVSGARVLHLTLARGGRVPELLQALLPLMRGVGVQVEWRVLFGAQPLHRTARALDDGLQGAETVIDDAAWSDYRGACEEAARSVGEGYDQVVLHDPGALGMTESLAGRSLVWRCHLDAGRPDGAAWERTAPLVERCGTLVFPLDSFAPPESAHDRRRMIPPGIDPLSPQNAETAPLLSGRAVRGLGVDLSRPFCCQTLRFDRWKDPHAVIEAFDLAKPELPELQLVLAGRLESEEAEAWRVVKEVTDYAAGRPGVRVLTSYEGLGNLDLGGLQRLARLVLTKSVREGFGLVASEALWKGTPVVGSPDGGVPLQVRDGIEGYLTDSAEATAERMVELVRDPGLAIEMGRAGRERVRERFLLTRVLEDELRLLHASRSGAGATVESQ